MSVSPLPFRNTRNAAAPARPTGGVNPFSLAESLRSKVERSERVDADEDRATARAYGPGVFAATHFSWGEYDTYTKDPAGAGARIVAAKAQAFRELADKLKQQDPVAYDFFTGNQWGDRITTALLSFVSVLTVALFLVVAGIFVLGALITTSVRGLGFSADIYRQKLVEAAGTIAAWLDGRGIDLSQDALIDTLRNLPVSRAL